MIIFVVRRSFALGSTVNFLKTWGKDLQPRVRLAFYGDLRRLVAVPRATYIFTDVERLSSAELDFAGEMGQQLAQAGVRVLNQPERVLRRYDLLHLLYEKGVNTFAVYRLADSQVPRRFPVFIRREHTNDGSLTPLIHTEHELQREIHRLLGAGTARNELMIVEFCDTSPVRGVYPKYSALLIGDQLIPRHVILSNEWVTKNSTMIDKDLVREKIDYLKQSPHPHGPRLREIFQLAGIDFGRIDYGLKDGEIQVWEIETYPLYVKAGSKPAPQRLAKVSRINQLTCSAVESLDDGATLSDNWIPLQIASSLRDRIPERSVYAPLAVITCRQAAIVLTLLAMVQKAFAFLRKLRIIRSGRSVSSTSDRLNRM